jgi:integrase
MPLTPKLRGKIWHVEGRVHYNGRPITDYIRASTGSSTQAGARAWIAETEEREIRRHLIGETHSLSFGDAVMLYQAGPDMAKDLIPLTLHLGHRLVADITPAMVRDLGPLIYPKACTDTWRRRVITPVRAVINNAHDQLGGKLCPPIKITGYSSEQRTAQDMKRGKPSRVERQPGSWEWLLQFRTVASPRLSALALFMFMTGARIGQAVKMHPQTHLDLQNARACIPAAKGHADRWITIPMELVVELANLPATIPRGWPRTKANLRLFGYAARNGPLKSWQLACKKAGIPYLPPHSAGRHGFGQEMNIRQPVDEKAAGQFGGWADTGLMRRTYTHAEDSSAKIHEAFRTGLAQAEKQTGLKLLK